MKTSVVVMNGGAPGFKWMGANMHWPQACITEPHPEPSRPVGSKAKAGTS